jgi:uncharacterized protein YndB with AHSA1/START domain
MHEVHVQIDIQAPIERVFDALSDHESFFRGQGIRSCRLTSTGQADRNGVGAVREIDAMGNRFVEEVVRFERPRRFDYLIRSVKIGPLKLPMRHELGWLELSEHGGRTHVDWRTRFGFGVPVVGGLLDRLAGQGIGAAFTRLLEQAKGELERARAAA